MLKMIDSGQSYRQFLSILNIKNQNEELYQFQEPNVRITLTRRSYFFSNLYYFMGI